MDKVYQNHTVHCVTDVENVSRHLGERVGVGSSQQTVQRGRAKPEGVESSRCERWCLEVEERGPPCSAPTSEQSDPIKRSSVFLVFFFLWLHR